jgi:hypothetical protein
MIRRESIPVRGKTRAKAKGVATPAITAAKAKTPVRAKAVVLPTEANRI